MPEMATCIGCTCDMVISGAKEELMFTAFGRLVTTVSSFEMGGVEPSGMYEG